MTKKIVFTRPDGGVSVTTPADPSLLQRALDAIPKEFNPVVVDDTALPQDRKDRHAWTINNGVVSIDPTKVGKIDLP